MIRCQYKYKVSCSTCYTQEMSSLKFNPKKYIKKIALSSAMNKSEPVLFPGLQGIHYC